MIYSQACKCMISTESKGEKGLEESIVVQICDITLFTQNIGWCCSNCHPRVELLRFNFRKIGNHFLLWQAQFLKNPVIEKSDISPLNVQSSGHLSNAVTT